MSMAEDRNYVRQTDSLISREAASYVANKSPIAITLYRLRYTGQRQPLSLDALVGQQKTEASYRSYRVRLGDTLRSIALRDPLMAHPMLWRLIAHINGLSEEQDVTGSPMAVLQRGQTILLPGAYEIAQYKGAHGIEHTTTGMLPATFFGVLQGPGELQQRTAKLVRESMGLQHEVEELAQMAKKLQQAREQLIQESEKIKQGPKHKQQNTFEHEEDEPYLFVHDLAEDCRIITADKGEDKPVFTTRLQIKTNNRWSTIASYDCRNGQAFRFTHGADGSISPVPLDLPISVIREMSKEDFSRNWAAYYREFIGKIQNYRRLL